MDQRIRIRTMQNLQVAPLLSNGSYNLAGADLQNAHLNGAKLIGVDLSGANLTRAALIDVDLSGANLTGANLTNANLARANLTGANLRRAILTRANTTGATLDDNTVLQDAVLDGTYGSINIRSVAERELELERRRYSTPWIQDADCDDQEDAITYKIIEKGRGFKLKEDNDNNYDRCYDVVTLATLMNKKKAINPYTTNPFSDNDKKRIEDYMRRNPIGGKKRKTYKKTNKKRKAKKVTRKNRRKQNKK